MNNSYDKNTNLITTDNTKHIEHNDSTAGKKDISTNQIYNKFRISAGFILFILILISSVFVPLNAYADANTSVRFSDVPEGHWADREVHQLRDLEITGGIGGNNFGLGLPIYRGEFVTYLVRLMKWELITPETGSFIDNMDHSEWYYPYVETALKNGAIFNTADNFRPEEPITREEMAIMIVNALKYDTLAKQLNFLGSPFPDVTGNAGYITIAKDFGIITGVGGNFLPDATATREQAALMMIRMYEKRNLSINELHAFYAIRSSNQSEMIKDLSSVSFGWCRLEFDSASGKVVLNTSINNSNEYALPAGFFSVASLAEQHKASAQLMVAVKNERVVTEENKTGVPLYEYILLNSDIRAEVIEAIIRQVNETTRDNDTISFDGVVIDFEEMKGEALRQSFNEFLTDIKQSLDSTGKKLYVAVHPRRRPGQAFYDAYDYKTIGEIADKVILMAHDYYAKSLTENDMKNGYTITPLTPIDEIYYALKAITDENAGVADLNKIWLQISFDGVQWKLKDGKVITQYPYKPVYEDIYKRIKTDVTMNYSSLNQNPYMTYYDAVDETDNVIWYEDSRSIQAKINLAKMFGVQGISLWRLGNIPDYADEAGKTLYLDVWRQILTNKSRNN